VVAEAAEVEAAGDDGDADADEDEDEDEDEDGTAGEDDDRNMPPPPVADEAAGEEGVDSVVVALLVDGTDAVVGVGVGVGETVMAGVVETEATEVVVCEAALEDAVVIAEPLPLEVEEASDDAVAPLWLRRHEGVFPELEADDDAADGDDAVEGEDAAERVKLRGRVLDA
jgi:hypothetical protein